MPPVTPTPNQTKPTQPTEPGRPIEEAPAPAPKLPIKKASFLKRHRWSFAIVSGALILTAGLMYFLLVVKNPTPPIDNSNQIPAKKKPAVYQMALSGIETEDQTKINQPVIGVMLENSPDARPQSGLKAAEVVFEAIAEGGITRFLAFYQSEHPDTIGPIRSLRSYYVDWLTSFDAGIVHVGGSQSALNRVRGGGYRDLDEFLNGGSFYRARDRWAPHNLYAKFSNLVALNQSKGFDNSNPKMFVRQKPKASDTVAASKIDFNISSPTYNPQYQYNSETNKYLRFQAGSAHLDREQGQIEVDAAIALMVDMRAVMEDGYREEIKTVGEGKAYIFQNGQAITATWRKTTSAESIHFFDQENKEIAINSGKVWLSAVPQNRSVSWQ